MSMIRTALAMALTTVCWGAESWPTAAADGDFTIPRQGLDLTDDLSAIRTAWQAPIHTGVGKTSGKGMLEAIAMGVPADEVAYGEMANLIVADGLVIASWNRPSGDLVAPRDSVDHRYYSDETKADMPDALFRIDADWHTVALDATTGELRWRTSEPSASMHILPGKREHHGISGAAGDGVYVTVTILGDVFAYDLATGERRWQTTVGPWSERARAFKQQCLDERVLPTSRSDTPFPYQRGGAAVVAGMAVVPDLQGGLVGLDLSDGSERWRTADVIGRQAVPQIWHDGERDWLLCNGHLKGHAGAVRLLDPATGAVAWTLPSGDNPALLVTGENHLLLNMRSDPGKNDHWQKGQGLWSCFRLAADGASMLWTLPDEPENYCRYKPDRGADRIAAIRDGIIYASLGTKPRHLVRIDLASGEILEREARDFESNGAQPLVVDNMLYWQIDGAHSGGRAGLIVYAIEEDGSLRYLGKTHYTENGIYTATGYQFMPEIPYHDGKLFLRGWAGIAALDLTVPTGPQAQLLLHDAWAGAGKPVPMRLFADDSGRVTAAKVDPPRAGELGIVYTTGRRHDGWGPVVFDQPPQIGAEVELTPMLDFGAFEWQATIDLALTDGAWTGTWRRSIAGWDNVLELSGVIHETSTTGHDAKVWPTPWLTDTPFSRCGALPDGQTRSILTLAGAAPYEDQRDFLTIAIDHDDTSIRGAVGGAFKFSQGWHEIDTSGLTVDATGIRGEAIVILNGDRWRTADPINGDALVGRLVIDARFASGAGVRPLSGTWQLTWGLPLERSGRISSHDLVLP